MSVEVRLAHSADLDEVFALRHEVFVVGQGVPVGIERDQLDDAADHAVARRDGVLVGTGRLVRGRIDEDGRLVPGTTDAVGTIGRMAVTEPARGTGTGRALLDLLVARAAELGLPSVRGVEVAPPGVELSELRVAPLAPETTGTVPAPRRRR